MMSSQAVSLEVPCAVEVFLATALLHREQPERNDFTIQEIVTRAALRRERACLTALRGQQIAKSGQTSDAVCYWKAYAALVAAGG
jgi:hypothetical protein